MPNKNNTQAIIPKLYCSIFGHNYQIARKVTHHVKEYKCLNCKKELTTNSNGNLVELTPKFKEINGILERIHQSRMNRLKKKTFASSIY